MKIKDGDRIKITLERPGTWNFDGYMDWLFGATLTVGEDCILSDPAVERIDIPHNTPVERALGLNPEDVPPSHRWSVAAWDGTVVEVNGEPYIPDPDFQGMAF